MGSNESAAVLYKNLRKKTLPLRKLFGGSMALRVNIFKHYNNTVNDGVGSEGVRRAVAGRYEATAVCEDRSESAQLQRVGCRHSRPGSRERSRGIINLSTF